MQLAETFVYRVSFLGSIFPGCYLHLLGWLCCQALQIYRFCKAQLEHMCNGRVKLCVVELNPAEEQCEGADVLEFIHALPPPPIYFAVYSAVQLIIIVRFSSC